MIEGVDSLHGCEWEVIPDRIEAAKDLGANRWQVFREVELPLAAPGLTIGASAASVAIMATLIVGAALVFGVPLRDLASALASPGW